MNGKKILASLTLLLGLHSVSAQADRYVINEMKKLRDSLSPGDHSRKELALRLADLLVDEGIISARVATGVNKNLDLREALELYKEVLSSPVNPQLQTKIEFQMARLYLELGQNDAAKPLLMKIAEQGSSTDLKRESLLRLAELSNSIAYYRQALSLCAGTDMCSLSHYRISWILRNEGKIREAIDEMKLALWDSKQQIREESLRDWMSFIGLQNYKKEDPQFQADLQAVEALSTQLKRPEMLAELQAAYFASGNKSAGVATLELVNARNPSISSQIALLEETFGMRDWERFGRLLEEWKLSTVNPAQVAAIKDPAHLEKICKRIAIQLDGERTTNRTRVREFQEFTANYLKLFPSSSERIRLMEGWVASEEDSARKLSQLGAWITESKFTFTAKEEFELRELRVSIAQKASDRAVVLAELAGLIALAPQYPAAATKLREYRYVRAKTLYDQKSYDEALTEFKSLAALTDTDASPDQWAVQSEQLALDILNLKKDYAGIVSLAKAWTTHPKLASQAKYARDLQEISEIQSQAEFEQAVSLGTSEAGLQVFLQYCKSGKFFPKSCENAKIIAVKLNKHPELIAVLEKLGSEDLVSEYEIGAYFTEAARILEKKITDRASMLKTALLYELGQDLTSRDRVLERVLQDRKGAPPSEAEAMALFLTLSDAGMITSRLLSLPWGEAFKLKVADRLESIGKGDALTKKLLLASSTWVGPSWEKLVIAETQKLEDAEKKIKFYGRKSQILFELRMKAQKKLAAYADHYLNGANASTRVELLTILQTSYDRLAQEILNSPIPPEVAEDQKAQIAASLSEMAKPFIERAQAFSGLLAQTKSQLPAPSLAQTEIQKSLQSPVAALSAATLLEQLHQNPRNTAAMTELQNLHQSLGRVRLAKYYEGRIKQIQQEGATP